MTMARVALAEAPLVPLRHLVEFNPRPRSITSEESCYLPMEAISEFGDVDSSRMRPTADLMQGYSFIRDGDVAYAKVTPCFENGKGMYAHDLPGGYAFATTEITVLRPRPGLEPSYLAWVLQSDGFRSPGESHMSGAGGLKRVPEAYTAISYPVPAAISAAGYRGLPGSGDGTDRCVHREEPRTHHPPHRTPRSRHRSSDRLGSWRPEPRRVVR